MIEGTLSLEQQQQVAAWLEIKEKDGYTLSELIDEFTGRSNESIPE